MQSRGQREASEPERPSGGECAGSGGVGEAELQGDPSSARLELVM